LQIEQLLLKKQDLSVALCKVPKQHRLAHCRLLQGLELDAQTHDAPLVLLRLLCCI